MTVGDVCTVDVVTADSREPLVDVARRMRQQHVGCVVVTEGSLRPVGIVTDRDIVVSAIAQTPDRLGEVRAADVMSEPLLTAKRGDDLIDALKRIRAHGVRRLPVVTEDGQLDGILTVDDILAAIASEIGEIVSLVTREQRRERAIRK